MQVCVCRMLVFRVAHVLAWSVQVCQHRSLYPWTLGLWWWQWLWWYVWWTELRSYYPWVLLAYYRHHHHHHHQHHHEISSALITASFMGAISQRWVLRLG